MAKAVSNSIKKHIGPEKVGESPAKVFLKKFHFKNHFMKYKDYSQDQLGFQICLSKVLKSIIVQKWNIDFSGRSNNFLNVEGKHLTVM